MKEEALVLVGAELRPIVHTENKKKQRKRGKLIILPDSRNGDQVNQSGKKIYVPNWNKPATHTDNKLFIEVLTVAVSAVPVSPFVCLFV